MMAKKTLLLTMFLKGKVVILTKCHSFFLFKKKDVGGQDKIRPLWRHYYAGTQALIFVVDSSDVERIDEAKTELNRIINDREMKDAVLLVYANKTDLPNIMDTSTITEKLGLHRLKERNWHIQACNGLNGEGLLEGLIWLNSYIH